MKQPDLTSVRTLVTSVTALARHLKLSNNAIYRWIKVNRIPGAHIVRVANFYDIEIRDLLPLTGSDESNAITLTLKPRKVLETLMQVFQEKMTLAQAAAQTNSSEISLKLIMIHWGDELPTLYTTLEQLDQGRITLTDAMARLKVQKYTLHGIRRKYGYAPGKLKRVRPLPTINKRKAANREVALACIRGRMTVREAAEASNISERTLFRTIESLSPVKMNELAHWPQSFRSALAVEIEENMPHYSQKWFNFAETSRFYLKKNPKYPEMLQNWRNQPLRRLLIGSLLGEESLENIALSRGADPKILSALFTGDLRVLDLTYEEVMGLPIVHQTALAELLIASMDRQRKLK